MTKNRIRNETLVGKLLNERYLVVKICTSGSFGETYLAEDVQHSEHPICFVKRFKPTTKNLHLIKVAKLMFEREAKITSSLGNSRYIPRLLATFSEKNQFYLVQEFIQGHTLYSELATGDCWEENQVIQLLQEVLPILEFIHSHGIIHRDIKPSNLIRRWDDHKLVLIDFGVAKLINNDLEEINNSKDHKIIVGTPGYMPSEQAQAHSCFGSDIYALGIIAIETLTGTDTLNLSFDPKTHELSWEHLVSVSSELIAIINKMVCQDYHKRYQSASEVLKALEHYQQKQKSELKFLLLENTSNLIAEQPVNSKSLTNSTSLVKSLHNNNYSNKIFLIGIIVSIATTWPIALGIYYFIWLLNNTDNVPNPSSPASLNQDSSSNKRDTISFLK
ncbi:serine/threonine protein kinase [Stanieria cyanosphaera PCC 7437]|uniref:non-specific serine/threonine protein kinase n=1 Tax=Stanieria cyanosphaera (strain ATCC 29371 / PCC 7437) TaxID=111780 RepID=K9XQW4_STAC7|nr:serine/threonine-protein kinase [Stanieria cyanosphaera]AFZ35005.1 serine/threonine protein kinase [Stanieria cyanosphaera PCC 7437]